MLRFLCLTLAFGFLLTASASAEPARFKFVKGQVLVYNIVQYTKVTETLVDEKTSKPVETELVTRHTVARHWRTTDVDAKGTATFEMTIASMRWERKPPGGMAEVFDSALPDSLNKEEMAKLIGPVLAVIRVDAFGKVIEVKESKFSSSARFAAELPFKIILPASGLAPGQSWDRPFTIKLDPPHGAGETYEAKQLYKSGAPVNGLSTIGITTTVNEMPKQVSDQIPLLPMLLEGDVYFHEGTGRYQAARLRLKKELINHAGEGSKYLFETTYSEDLKE